MRCPEHPEVRVKADGTYKVKGQVRQRYRCRPEGEKAHTFAVVIRRDSHASPKMLWSPPPPCERHPGSHVVRNGTYGKGKATRRQRYLCRPSDGSPSHAFTPPLPRDHVHSGVEQCDVCEELLGTHNGQPAVARRHTWSARIVARGLEKLAGGDTYAETGNWAISVTGTTRTRRSKQATTDTAPPAEGAKRVSRASRDSRAAWHIAADWVEAFAPVLYDPLDRRLREEALAERARLDALRAGGDKLDRPQVVLIDDIPVWGREPGKPGRRSRQTGYAILVVAELVWPDPALVPDAGAEDAAWFEDENQPNLRLRLVRAMPNVTATSWLLVLDELGYVPDVVVTDGAKGADLALRTLYANTPTTVVPSMWHLRETIKRAFVQVPAAWALNDKGEQDLIEPLGSHLRSLRRRSVVQMSSRDWAKWWDDLEAMVTAQHYPVEKVRKSRSTWEPAVASALSVMRQYPEIHVSTGGLESVMRSRVKPILEKRGNAFANIERTNRLFDLVVVRAHGGFEDLGAVARALRADAESVAGWTVPLRTIADPRPNRSSYSSLRDAVLIDDLARARKLVP